MALPASLPADSRSSIPSRLWAALVAMAAGFVALCVGTSKTLAPDLQTAVSVLSTVLPGLGAVLAYNAAPPHLTRVRAIVDGALGGAAVLVAAGIQLLYAPSWPALFIVALALCGALSLRGGALTARIAGGGAAAAELVHLLGPRVDVPGIVGLAAASAFVPLAVEYANRAWRTSVEQWAKDTVDQRLRAIDEDARAYRLIASTTGGNMPIEARESRRKIGSVQAIRESNYAVMELCSRVMDPHTIALFLLDGTGTELKVQEMISRSDFVVTTSLPANKGVLGTVCKKKQPLALRSLKDEFAGVTWYHPALLPKALLAVPVFEGEHLRGVLLCDWTEDRELTDRDTTILSAVAREITRSSENERLFATLDREKSQMDSLYKVSQDFLKAFTPPDIFSVTLKTAKSVSDASIAVLCLKEGDKLRIAAVDGISSEAAGRTVVDESGMLTACLMNQTMFPAAASEPERMRVVLGAETPLDGVESIRILPFREKTEAIGVLLVGSPRRNAFPFYVDDRLQMVADMASLALANARLYQRMERMATTDGLTGLLNHRTFQERFSEALKRSARTKRPLSMFLTDIDHFKNVNDTYGHPVGDEVIRRVAGVLQGQARATDIVARYGGEEFAVVMEDTDAQGGLVFAERIRQAVQKEVVQTEMGPLKVTLSLGVAAYPTHGEEKHILIERADQALYQAKHSGRNRAVVASAPATKEEAHPSQPEKS